MKITHVFIASAASLLLGSPALAQQTATPDPIHKYTWGENIGWINTRDAADGFVSLGGSGNESPGWYLGYLWSENAGWIRLSSRAAPAAGLGPHLNTDHTNWGVNAAQAGFGPLSGFAWAENLGWINFNVPGPGGVTVFNCGRVSGYAWSENAGWIDFSTLRFRPICPADYNCSVAPAVTVQDIFDFLEDWFSARPAADFNRDGTVSIQDIFEFLTAWFNGC